MAILRHTVGAMLLHAREREGDARARRIFASGRASEREIVTAVSLSLCARESSYRKWNHVFACGTWKPVSVTSSTAIARSRPGQCSSALPRVSRRVGGCRYFNAALSLSLYEVRVLSLSLSLSLRVCGDVCLVWARAARGRERKANATECAWRKKESTRVGWKGVMS